MLLRRVVNLLKSGSDALGEELLVIGWEVSGTKESRLDILAISAAGTVYIIELKFTRAKSDIVEQVARYSRLIAWMDRDDLIALAAHQKRGIDLEESFLKRFQLPLPWFAGTNQVLVTIAAAYPSATAQNLLHLRSERRSVTLWLHVIDGSDLFILPWPGRGNSKEHSFARVPLPTRSSRQQFKAVQVSRVRPDVELYWASCSRAFQSPVVPFVDIYADYLKWHRHLADQGMLIAHQLSTTPIQIGLFGLQLSIMVEDDLDWIQCRVPAGTRVNPHDPSASIPEWREDKAFRFVSAYRRSDIAVAANA